MGSNAPIDCMVFCQSAPPGQRTPSRGRSVNNRVAELSSRRVSPELFGGCRVADELGAGRMTEVHRAVKESPHFNLNTEWPKRIVRNLEPARPLRRLNMYQADPQSCANTESIEKQDNIIKVENFYEILHHQSTSSEPEKKAERICYHRDFLIEMASCPMAKKKPEFLPEHPVVLENCRADDVPRYLTSHNNHEDLSV